MMSALDGIRPVGVDSDEKVCGLSVSLEATSGVIVSFDGKAVAYSKDGQNRDDYYRPHTNRITS